MSFEGVMSFFPLVNDQRALAELDAWLEVHAWLAMRKRAALLTDARLPAPKPHGFSKSDLAGWRTISSETGEPVDLRLPSFSRISGVIRSAVTLYGLNPVSRSGISDYHYGEPAEL